MRVPLRPAAIAASLVLTLVASIVPHPTAVSAAGEKVVVIVGPVADLTDKYRAHGDALASAAEAAGATVVKVYSPNATWQNVRAAVEGANVIVYFGHGNGYPNPYSSGSELTDRVNGWGLNRTSSGGDADDWATTMVYCGEKALLGTLTASDGAAQRQYCSGGPIRPAPNFVMVYGQAHYTSGFGERYAPSTPVTTLDEAQTRVANYSYPILKLGGAGYLATAYGDADAVVSRLLTDPRPFGELFASGVGYSPGTLTVAAHPDIPGAETWVQRTTISGFHFNEPDYWYAFAGDPAASMSRAPGYSGTPLFNDISGSSFKDSIMWLAQAGITGGCGGGRFCPNAPVTRQQMASFLARGLQLSAASIDYFSDDDASPHQADINRLAASGITGGCAAGRFCPTDTVTREQMASFLARGLGLPGSATDFFDDDAASRHQLDINRLASSGITGGCGVRRFCPASTVTRGQMAAFLHRALGN
ncbi:MAG: S-layer homology domain-containing protein [Candidatus Limnocylindria bacterium]